MSYACNDRNLEVLSVAVSWVYLGLINPDIFENYIGSGLDAFFSTSKRNGKGLTLKNDRLENTDLATTHRCISFISQTSFPSYFCRVPPVIKVWQMSSISISFRQEHTKLQSM